LAYGEIEGVDLPAVHEKPYGRIRWLRV
jgi:hypothetical protein